MAVVVDIGEVSGRDMGDRRAVGDARGMCRARRGGVRG